MEITATLEAINSRADIYGNRYWAFRFADHTTGRTISGRASGGESNIYGILRHWGAKDGRDRSVRFLRTELPIRVFDRLAEDWPYAGSQPDELARFIRMSLDTMTGTVEGPSRTDQAR
jgi:hypothetical protein